MMLMLVVILWTYVKFDHQIQYLQTALTFQHDMVQSQWSPKWAWLDGPEHTIHKNINYNKLFTYMVPKVFFSHKHQLKETHGCFVVTTFIMGLCTSLISNLDEWGWHCSHVTKVIFSFMFPFFLSWLADFGQFFILSFLLSLHHGGFCPVQIRKESVTYNVWGGHTQMFRATVDT